MAKISDWFDLADDTVRKVRTREMSNLYTVEWLEAQRMLTSDFSDSLDRQKGRAKRFVYTINAVLFGMAKRLAPQRRLIFIVAQVVFVWSFFSMMTSDDPTAIANVLGIFGTFVLMTLLLGLELIDKLKIRNELELARDLQASLIPEKLPRVPDYELDAFNRIANTVGGDIYDFVPLKDGRLAVLFGDASGHGMAAGLVMAVAQAAFRTQLEIDPSPLAIFTSLNRILLRVGGNRSFFSACYLVLSPGGGYELVLGGHPELLKVDGAGRVVARIGRGAYPLGIKEQESWEILEGSLGYGESLVLHSDGLTESRNPEGKELGDAYLETVIGWQAGARASEMLEEIVAEWKSFCAGAPVEDDVTVAVIRRRMD
ncbi:MAG: serine/threonine-protein phosphatase [Thermoanaerobaculia bacterium]|nr:serine/threonine-protein phosphatase [Thermoanaerobaculia bacterium]